MYNEFLTSFSESFRLLLLLLLLLLLYTSLVGKKVIDAYYLTNSNTLCPLSFEPSFFFFFSFVKPIAAFCPLGQFGHWERVGRV